MNAPVFSLFNSVLWRSDFDADSLIYFSTSSFCSCVVISFTSGCSGDNTQYVAPKIVSGLVVNTVNSLSVFDTLKLISAPIDFPIQFLCISVGDSGQSI